GRPFYAMRFISGETLRDAIRRFHQAEVPGRDPAERAVAFRELLQRFIDVCNAVAYAHSRGVLHRDLKPANVMLGPFGETLVVDWGLAKLITPAPGPADDTACHLSPPAYPVSPLQSWIGQRIGTPQYMAPEQDAGRVDLVDQRTDVYLLGGILYEIL